MDNYILHEKFRRFPMNTQFIGPPLDCWLRMLLPPPPREFRKLILSKRGFQAASFNICLHYVRRSVSL